MKTTHREYLTWEHWLQEEWNSPTRSDYYLMQLTQRVMQILRKNPNQVKLEDQKIPFSFGAKKKPTGSKLKAITAMAKAKWKAVMGSARKPKDGS